MEGPHGRGLCREVSGASSQGELEDRLTPASGLGGVKADVAVSQCGEQ